MTNYQRTAAWLAACGKQPGDPRSLAVQIACHIEEFIEFLDAVHSPQADHERLLEDAARYLNTVANSVKKNDGMIGIRHQYRAAALDALCDMEVTGNGVAFLAGFDKDAADAAVLASNDAKLVDGKPVLLPGGKIGKPAGWSAPDLGEFV